MTADYGRPGSGNDEHGEWDGVRVLLAANGGHPIDLLPESLILRSGHRLILQIGDQEWEFKPHRTWAPERVR